MALARETPRLRFSAVEPGFSPATGLSRDANVLLRFLGNYVLSPLAPFIKYWSTPARAAKVITNALLNEPGGTGVYYDEQGQPMLGSTLVRDPVPRPRRRRDTRPALHGLGLKPASASGLALSQIPNFVNPRTTAKTRSAAVTPFSAATRLAVLQESRE